MPDIDVSITIKESWQPRMKDAMEYNVRRGLWELPPGSAWVPPDYDESEGLPMDPALYEISNADALELFRRHTLYHWRQVVLRAEKEQQVTDPDIFDPDALP